MDYEVYRPGDPQPTWKPRGEDCMGGVHPGYWQQVVHTYEGEIVIGRGANPEVAIEEANTLRRKREEFLEQDPKKIIEDLIKQGCRGTREQEDFNRAVARVLGIVDPVYDMERGWTCPKCKVFHGAALKAVVCPRCFAERPK